MKTLIKELPEMEKICAEKVRQLLKEKPGSVLALTAGRTTEGLYALLGDMCRRGELSFREAKIFAVTEYVGGEEADSCRSILKRQLIDHTDLPEGNFFVPREQEPEKYDGLIEAAGGIDLCILGIGINGHLAFNEAQPELSPEEFAQLGTRVLTLTPETKTANAIGDRGGAIIAMPNKAITIGIKQILSARKVRLGVFRDWHRGVVRQAAYGEVSASFPVTLLQRHPDAAIYANATASALPF